MNASSTIDLLEHWNSLLSKIESIEVSSTLSFDAMSLAMDERQQILDQIQSLDASIQKTVALRKAKWSGFTAEETSRVERLVQNGLAICQRVVDSNSQVYEIIAKKREGVRDALKELAQKKNYMTSLNPSLTASAVIVDDRA